MRAHGAQAYLELPADDRFETRLPRRLKQDAEAVAEARGESLSEYVTGLLAERVAEDIVATQEWKLTPAEQVELLRVLSALPPVTPALRAAQERAAAQGAIRGRSNPRTSAVAVRSSQLAARSSQLAVPPTSSRARPASR